MKDVTSDMAVASKRGSQLMRDFRERRGAAAATKEKLSLAGTVIGRILGVEQPAPSQAADEGERGGRGQEDVQDDAFSARRRPTAVGAAAAAAAAAARG